VRWLVAALALASGCDSAAGPTLVNYRLETTNVPVCPAPADRNYLQRPLVVRAEPNAKEASQWGFSGQSLAGGGQVNLRGPQEVTFRFGVCPPKDRPRGVVKRIGCEDREIYWYAEHEVALDPARLVVVGRDDPAPGTHPTVELPWPPGPMDCWEGTATPSPRPL
jgi:hypothetical protein